MTLEQTEMLRDCKRFISTELRLAHSEPSQMRKPRSTPSPTVNSAPSQAKQCVQTKQT